MAKNNQNIKENDMLNDNYTSTILNPSDDNYRNVIYDNLSNSNSYGINGKFGTQFAILTFLNKTGSIDKNSVKNETYSMILREPFRVSLSTKQPNDSPYVSLINEFQNANKKRCGMASVGSNNDNKPDITSKGLLSMKNVYDPINLTDNFSIKMYSGTEHPNFSLNGRIYMDRTIFRPIQDGNDIFNNYEYSIKFILRILSCILPLKGKESEILQQFKEKFQTALPVAIADGAGLLKWLLGVEAVKGVISKGGATSFINSINTTNEGTYGTNLVSFCIPWVFGNLATFGSEKINVKSESKKDENGNLNDNIENNNININYGNMLQTKCFIKHFDYKLSKEYYVEKIISNGVCKEKRYPSYIDINLTLESVNIPSVHNWLYNWVNKNYSYNPMN